MIAAVDIWGPAFRLTPRRIPELAAQAREAAAAISVRLGGTAPDRAGPRAGRPADGADRLATLGAMPDFAEAPWSDIVAFARGTLLPVLLIVVVALVAMRLARSVVHGIVKALLDREATEGTAQELSAIELKKRMDTLDDLGVARRSSSSSSSSRG